MRQTLTLANHLSELDKLSQWVERLGEELDLSPRQVFHLNLALEEVVTNVMKYAYGPEVDLPIGVEMEAGPEMVRVRVTDQGPEFNPLALPPPETAAPLDERRVGGVGIYLTEQIMDKLSYARQGQLNVLTLELARRERDGQDAAGGDSDGDH
jgi:anti-sigma regulatory factor (Ser/Thr protein kinase)